MIRSAIAMEKLKPLFFRSDKSSFSDVLCTINSLVLRQLYMTFLANLEIAALEISTKTGFEADI